MKPGDIIQTIYGVAKVEEVREELLVRIPPNGAGKLKFISINEVKSETINAR